ncbi:MAG: aspartate kinase [Oligoflexus sp.]
MSIVVQKYGGTSVATIERIQHVAKHIVATRQSHSKIVVVVSAMGKQTDQLLDMAYQISPSPVERELDMLLTVGERITMSLLSIALNDLGVSTISLTGSQSGIITDTYHGNARIKRILGDRIEHALESAKVVIVAGFQGVSLPSKDVTTLGRGGSDLTAIALADRLQAMRCEIYKDVDGICTADPRLVPRAQVIPKLSWNSLTHLTWAGSGVVHSRGAHLAEKRQIPLEIRSSFDLDRPGTSVGAIETMESAVIHAISHVENLSFIEVTHPSSSLTSHLTRWLWGRGTSPNVNQQYFTDRWLSRLSLPTRFLSDFQKMLNADFPQAKLDIIHEDLAAITVVGHGFRQEPEILDQVLSGLVSQPLIMECQNHTLTLFVAQQTLQANMSALHEKIFSEKSQET